MPKARGGGQVWVKVTCTAGYTDALHASEAWITLLTFVNRIGTGALCNVGPSGNLTRAQ